MIDSSDSGLRCPSCGYNVTGLHSNLCPECGEAFKLIPAKAPSFLANHKPGFLESSSMTCPTCGHNNGGIMPAACAKCGKQFTIWQRLFGTTLFRIG